MNKIFINYLESKEKSGKPLWIMRQAGRTLPEYLELRKKFNNFLDLCYTPEAVCEVTLQPIKRFDYDAAIIFSDILMIPDFLGQGLRFDPGPIIEELTEEQIFNLNFTKFDDKSNKVYKAISLTKEALSTDKILIGFAGAAWTLACYMLGKSNNDFKNVKVLAYNESKILDFLIEGLTESIKLHLSNQIKAGADIVQIFDSWAGILSGTIYDKYVIEPTKKIVEYLKIHHPKVKIIGFAKDSGIKYSDYLKTNIDIMGLDQYIDLDWATKNLGDKIILQGNLDPLILLCDNEEKLRKHINIYLDKIRNYKFICNLGHGIIPETPIKNIEIFRQMVKDHG